MITHSKTDIRGIFQPCFVINIIGNPGGNNGKTWNQIGYFLALQEGFIRYLYKNISLIKP